MTAQHLKQGKKWNPSGRRPSDLPSIKKVTFDWEHIFEGHWEGTPEVIRGNNTIFTGLNKEQIKRVVRGAYKYVNKKNRTQGDRIRVRGSFEGWIVEMWVNKADKIVETAYPIFQVINYVQV